MRIKYFDERQVNAALDMLLANPIISSQLLLMRELIPQDVDHQVRVAKCGMDQGFKLADRLGLRRQDILQVGAGGLLHDFGKAWIPRQILDKEGKGALTEGEIAILARHPYLTFEHARTSTRIRYLMLFHHDDHSSKVGRVIRASGGYEHTARFVQTPRFQAQKELLIVSDIFDALTDESRLFYRNGEIYSDEQIKDILYHETELRESIAVSMIDSLIPSRRLT